MTLRRIKPGILIFSAILLLTIQACSSIEVNYDTLPPAVDIGTPGNSASSNLLSPGFASLKMQAGENRQVSFTFTTAEMPPQKVDLLFLFDVTGSMTDVLNEAKESGIQIMNSLSESYPDIAFGVASYADFPLLSYKIDDSKAAVYGDEKDYPWRLDKNISKDISSTGTVINELSILSGGDWAESTLTALHQAISIGWREGSRRIVVLFTDSPVHDPEFYLEAGGADYRIDPGPDGMIGTEDDLRMESTIRNLAENGLAVFTIYATDKPNDFIRYGFEVLADQTGGKVFDLENAADLSRILVDDLAGSIRSVGILSARAYAENNQDLSVTVSPQQYTLVPGGESRVFMLEVNGADELSSSSSSLVRVLFVADDNPVASADIAVELEKPQTTNFWWLLLGLLFLVTAGLYLFRFVLANQLKDDGQKPSTEHSKLSIVKWAGRISLVVLVIILLIAVVTSLLGVMGTETKKAPVETAGEVMPTEGSVHPAATESESQPDIFDDAVPVDDSDRLTHVVGSDDSLWSIAQFYGINMEAIQRANGMGDAPLSVGDTLVIPYINLNSADVDALAMLPGVGQEKAKAIAEYRLGSGILTDISQIMDVPGIGPAMFDGIKDLVVVNGRHTIHPLSYWMSPEAITQLLFFVSDKSVQAFNPEFNTTASGVVISTHKIGDGKVIKEGDLVEIVLMMYDVRGNPLGIAEYVTLQVNYGETHPGLVETLIGMQTDESRTALLPAALTDKYLMKELGIYGEPLIVVLWLHEIFD